MANERLSLLASNARVQAPWVKVSIGNYTFGVFSKVESNQRDDQGFYYTSLDVQYPNYIQRLEITKINGQVNQYALSLTYPVTQTSDPNFFEKVLSSVSKTRKIIFHKYFLLICCLSNFFSNFACPINIALVSRNFTIFFH